MCKASFPQQVELSFTTDSQTNVPPRNYPQNTVWPPPFNPLGNLKRLGPATPVPPNPTEPVVPFPTPYQTQQAQREFLEKLAENTRAVERLASLLELMLDDPQLIKDKALLLRLAGERDG